MSKLIIPAGYKSKLSARETQKAIKLIKDNFQVKLASRLNLDRITAPIIVESKSGINDDLNGVERKVKFDLKATGTDVEVVQSLAKWKRIDLHKYGYSAGEGIYTDMNALRRDDDMDNTHSVFVDQWDWEKIITKEDRNVDYLKDTVTKIVDSIADTLEIVKEKFPQIDVEIKREISFITTQELLDLYPDMSGKERENAYLKEHKTAFIMKIGNKLSNGEKHDGRAPDYDDWELNGDIMFYNELLGTAFEISSMGIRVDADSLKLQLKLADCEERKEFKYHKSILDGTLPLTIGGGIGQSRLCMLILNKAHIGEVHASVWSEEMIKECKENGIELL